MMDGMMDEFMPDIPSGFDLSGSQLDRIDSCLDNMLWETEAQCVLLADITGQLISEKGAARRMNTAVLSALAAGQLAATKELAKLVGEAAQFKLLLHEGEQQCVYLSDVGEELILVTVFDTSTAIGLVRLYIRETVKELLEVLQMEPDGSEEDDDTDIDDDFGDLLISQFDDIFSMD